MLASLLALGIVATPGQFDYPVARKGDVVEDHFGTQVADPYRWMEDVDAPEVKDWVQAENKLTFGYLRAIPQWKAIRARLGKLLVYERVSAPTKRGPYSFFTRFDGIRNQAVWYVKEGQKERILLNPNTLRKDGTASVNTEAPSYDGRYWAYALSFGGSDWMEWHILDLKTGKPLPEVLKWAKFSGAGWAKDGSGFFYGRYDTPTDGVGLQAKNTDQKVFFHKLGTDQSKDKLVYERPEKPEWYFQIDPTEDGKYEILGTSESASPRNYIAYRPTGNKGPFKELPGKVECNYNLLGNDGPVFYVLTNQGAGRNKIVSIDIRKPDFKNWKVIVPESKEALESASIVGSDVFATYLKDAHSQVRIFSLNGKAKGVVPLPGIGTAGGFGGLRTDRETFYTFSGFTNPGATYRFDLRTRQSSLYYQPKVAFNPSQYDTEEVFYPSKDGTKIPMFLSYKKGLKRNGQNPVLMNGYGGFNINTTPYFSTSVEQWMEMGGVYAVVVLRGGGEYGRAWYDAGRLKNKQNVFDDFIAGGEWLIKQKYTSKAKLACSGGSNGGLLVGAVITQRPDLWGAALPAVGVMDMLRYHKFTIGAGWMTDYMNPDTEEGFATLIKFSPLHNIHEGTHYPPTLITTGDHDDRVVPPHSFKFAATMQAAQSGNAPVLIRVETSAGHGAGKPLAKQLDERADMWAFLVKNLGMHPKL